MTTALDDLRPARFKGAGFHVRSDRLDAGRRLVVHHFTGGEAPLVEDFGADDRMFTVDAYAAGDASGPQARALSELFSAGGAGPLALPLGDFALARVMRFRRDRSLDRIGLVGFQVQFLVVTPAAGAALSPQALVATARGSAGRFAAAFASGFPA